MKHLLRALVIGFLIAAVTVGVAFAIIIFLPLGIMAALAISLALAGVILWALLIHRSERP